MKTISIESDKVFKWWDYPLFFLLTCLMIWAVLDFMAYWFSFQDWLHFPVSFFLLTFIVTIVLVNTLGRWFLLPKMRKPKPMTPRPGLRVAVVTTFVSSGESIEMLEETLKALVALEYPHDTWVLDEDNDERVKELCLLLGVNHYSRKNYPQYLARNGKFQAYSKHGNYNGWLYEIGFEKYDIVTAFDPDHVPNKDYLSKILGYFNDPKVGYIQVATSYYNKKASFIACGAAEETYAYHSSIQMAAFAMGYPIIIGSHNTHRVRALRQVGGFGAHDADDILITLLYRNQGWQGVYVPQILAKGLTPVDWHGYLNQQRRWARSVLDLKFRSYPKLSSNIPFASRIMNFLHGLTYIHRSLLIFVGLILLSYMLATGNSPLVFSFQMIPRLMLLFVVIQFGEFYRQRFYLDWQNELGLHWRVALLQFAKWPYFLLAFYDVLTNRRIQYALTDKISPQKKNYELFWPHIIMTILVTAAWCIGFITNGTLNPILHVSTAIVVLLTFIMISTIFMNFKSPFDKNLFILMTQTYHDHSRRASSIHHMVTSSPSKNQSVLRDGS